MLLLKVGEKNKRKFGQTLASYKNNDILLVKNQLTSGRRQSMHKDSGRSLPEKLKIFREMCKEAGIRLTHHRLELFREMAAAKDHPSAEDIYERIRPKMPTISLDTVYRTLATFERHGIIVRMQALGERSRYDSNPSPHHHLVCTECKRIQDFKWSQFDQMRAPAVIEGEWGSVNSLHIELRGLCKDCLRKRCKKSR